MTNRRGRGRLSSNAVLVVTLIALVSSAASLMFAQTLNGPRGYGDVADAMRATFSRTSR